MHDGKTGVALAALLTMSGVTMDKPEKKLAPEREKKSAPRRKLKPTEKERKLLGKLSEQERKVQETHKRCVEGSKVEHQIRVNAANNAGSSVVRDAKVVFDTEAKKLAKANAKALEDAKVAYLDGLSLLRTNASQVRRDVEKSLDAAITASARQHETEEMALTSELNTALTSIFAERESIEFGDKAGKGKGS